MMDHVVEATHRPVKDVTSRQGSSLPLEQNPSCAGLRARLLGNSTHLEEFCRTYQTYYPRRMASVVVMRRHLVIKKVRKVLTMPVSISYKIVPRLHQSIP